MPTPNRLIQNSMLPYFLSSSHEFASLDPELCGIDQRSELDFVKMVVEKHGSDRQFCVRCHPNQAQDKSWKETLSPLETYCRSNGIEYFSPTSSVSSYDLVRRSQITAVDISSIGLDAIYMNKQVDIFGQPDYRLPYEQLSKSHGSDMNSITADLATVMAIRRNLHHEKFSFTRRLWKGLARCI